VTTEVLRIREKRTTKKGGGGRLSLLLGAGLGTDELKRGKEKLPAPAEEKFLRSLLIENQPLL